MQGCSEMRSGQMNLAHNRNYVLFNVRLSATNFGYTLYMITVPAFSYLVSGSIIFTGIVLFMEYGIYAATFLAGPLVDRVVDKRYLIAAAEAAIGVCALLLGIVMLSPGVNDYEYLALIAAIAIFWDIVWTADHAVLPLIVEPSDLARANGYSSAVGNSHVAAGLAFGGFLFIVVGAYGSIITYSVCLFLASGITLLVPLVIPCEGRKLTAGLMSGWSYALRKNRGLLALSIISALFAFFTVSPVLSIAGLFAEKSGFLYAVMFSLYYIGAMVSGVAAGRFFPYRSLGKVFLLSGAVAGAFMILSVQVIHFLAVDAVMWFLLGLTLSLQTTLTTTYLQTVTEHEMLGRNASSLYTFRGITSAAGALYLPVLMSAYGIATTFAFSGLAVIAASTLLYILLPVVRSLSVNAGGGTSADIGGDDVLSNSRGQQ